MTEKQINAEDPLFLVNPNSGKLSSWDKADKIRSIYPGQKVNIVFPNSPDESAKIVSLKMLLSTTKQQFRKNI